MLFCTVDAFVACGGKPDKTGHVLRDTLVRIIKHDFGLTIDIEVRVGCMAVHAHVSWLLAYLHLEAVLKGVCVSA